MVEEEDEDERRTLRERRALWRIGAKDRVQEHRAHAWRSRPRIGEINASNAHGLDVQTGRRTPPRDVGRLERIASGKLNL